MGQFLLREENTQVGRWEKEGRGRALEKLVKAGIGGRADIKVSGLGNVITCFWFLPKH